MKLLKVLLPKFIENSGKPKSRSKFRKHKSSASPNPFPLSDGGNLLESFFPSAENLLTMQSRRRQLRHDTFCAHSHRRVSITRSKSHNRVVVVRGNVIEMEASRFSNSASGQLTAVATNNHCSRLHLSQQTKFREAIIVDNRCRSFSRRKSSTQESTSLGFRDESRN